MPRSRWPKVTVTLLSLAILASAPAVAQDIRTVSLTWRSPLESSGCMPYGTPSVDREKVFLVCSGVRAYASDSGRLLWKSESVQYEPHSIVTALGRLIVVEARVSALDEDTGEKKWEFRPDDNASLGRAVVLGDRVFFGTASHRLYCLRVSDGKVQWRTDLGSDWRFAAVVRGVAADGKVLYATVEQWRSENGTKSSGWLIALNEKTGNVIWRYCTGTDDERRGLSSSPVITSDLVLAADYLSNAIEAVNRKTGRQIWRFQGERGFVGFPEAPLVAGAMVYAGSGDRYVYALDLASGHLAWKTKMPASNEAYALCGKSILVNYRGLAALDLKTGKLVQTLISGRDEFVTSDFAAQEKRLFVAGPTGLFAFGCE